MSCLDRVPRDTPHPLKHMPQTVNSFDDGSWSIHGAPTPGRLHARNGIAPELDPAVDAHAPAPDEDCDDMRAGVAPEASSAMARLLLSTSRCTGALPELTSLSSHPFSHSMHAVSLTLRSWCGELVGVFGSTVGSDEAARQPASAASVAASGSIAEYLKRYLHGRLASSSSLIECTKMYEPSAPVRYRSYVPRQRSSFEL